MPKLPKILLLAVSTVLVFTAFLGMHSSPVLAGSDDPQDGDRAYRQIGVYSEVLRHIQSDYVSEPNIDAVTNGALRGLLESLDADSSYLTPADYKAYKANLAKGPGKAQVGIIISKRFSYATVVSIIPGSPADKVGLVDGDILEAIDGHDTRDISLAMLQMMLDGAPGTEVTVSVVRPRKSVPDKLTLARVVVSAPPVSEAMYENSSILYLKPVVLDRDHVQMIESKLKAAEKTGHKKVLLDLRDVASGDMAEAAHLANFFIKAGTLATLEGQKVEKVTYSADPGKAIVPYGGMIVLVNRGTAGPGELVAAALLEDKRADLVGEKTFGEGAQTRTFELPDGAALILSIAKYSGPDGKKLQENGVTPGVLVASAIPDTTDDGDSEDDTPAATTGAPITTPTAPVKPTVKSDDQLTKALDLLKAKAA